MVRKSFKLFFSLTFYLRRQDWTFSQFIFYLTRIDLNFIAHFKTQNMIAFARRKSFVLKKITFVVKLGGGAKPGILHFQAIDEEQLLPLLITFEVDNHIGALRHRQQAAIL